MSEFEPQPPKEEKHSQDYWSFCANFGFRPSHDQLTEPKELDIKGIKEYLELRGRQEFDELRDKKQYDPTAIQNFAKQYENYINSKQEQEK